MTSDKATDVIDTVKDMCIDVERITTERPMEGVVVLHLTIGGEPLDREQIRNVARQVNVEHGNVWAEFWRDYRAGEPDHRLVCMRFCV